MRKLRVALLLGGISNEREISLKSGSQVQKALNPDRYLVSVYDLKEGLASLVADAPGIDVALIILHGRFGEDGTVQGLLELLGIPYQGSGVLGSAVAMDKRLTKALYRQEGLPLAKDRVIRRGDRLVMDLLGEELGWRGTALPHLQARWNGLNSSLILGVVWGLYHLLSFLLSGLPLHDMPLISFMAGILGFTVLVTWTFIHTGGSLIPAFLYHLSFNFIGNATGIFGDPALVGALAVMYCVAGVAVIILDWAHFRHAGCLLPEASPRARSQPAPRTPIGS
jgi:hypothetical protein